MLSIDIDWDVVVIGAGPAGSVAAYLLASKGYRVLLVDKANFPRDKVCGCCLNAKCVAMLREVGLLESITKLKPVVTRGLRLHCERQSSLIRIPEGLSVSREALDHALAMHAVDAGACFSPHTSARVCEVDDLHDDAARLPLKRFVELESGSERTTVGAKIVLVADGLGGTALLSSKSFAPEVKPNSRIGGGTKSTIIPEWCRSGTIEMLVAKQGYIGFTILEDASVDIACAIDKRFAAECGGMSTAAMRIVQAAGLRFPDIEHLNWKGTPALTRSRRLVAANGVYVIGDAAGYAEPFTGQGMSWAVRSAIEVSNLVVHAFETDINRRKMREMESTWNSRFHTVVRREQRISLFISSLLRHPALIRAALPIIAKSPMVSTAAKYICEDVVAQHH